MSTDAFAAVPTLAAARRLVVISDFDGTLAGFKVDPRAVQGHPVALDALARLSRLPETTAAVLSGRHLAGLQEVCPLREPVILGGSHGAETAGFSPELSDADRAHLDRVEADIRRIMVDFPGADIEIKPFQRVLHLLALHNADPDAAERAYAAGLEIAPGDYPRTPGKMVVEFSATRATKGSWISGLLDSECADAAVFLGDDVTDEHGFAALNARAQDCFLGIKVGAGDTAAPARLSGIEEVARFLAALADARGATA